AHFGAWNAALLRRPDVQLVVGDGRRWLASSTDRYDVVVSDLFIPWHAGAGSLYAREMFETVARRLSPGGVFCQWLPLYQLTHEEFDAIARTFLAVFPEVSLWRNDFYPDRPVVGLVGRLAPGDSCPPPTPWRRRAERARRSTATRSPPVAATRAAPPATRPRYASSCPRWSPSASVRRPSRRSPMPAARSAPSARSRSGWLASSRPWSDALASLPAPAETTTHETLRLAPAAAPRRMQPSGGATAARHGSHGGRPRTRQPDGRPAARRGHVLPREVRAQERSGHGTRRARLRGPGPARPPRLHGPLRRRGGERHPGARAGQPRGCGRDRVAGEARGARSLPRHPPLGARRA